MMVSVKVTIHLNFSLSFRICGSLHPCPLHAIIVYSSYMGGTLLHFCFDVLLIFWLLSYFLILYQLLRLRHVNFNKMFTVNGHHEVWGCK